MSIPTSNSALGGPYARTWIDPLAHYLLDSHMSGPTSVKYLQMPSHRILKYSGQIGEPSNTLPGLPPWRLRCGPLAPIALTKTPFSTYTTKGKNLFCEQFDWWHLAKAEYGITLHKRFELCRGWLLCNPCHFPKLQTQWCATQDSVPSCAPEQNASKEAKGHDRQTANHSRSIV
jgi:hypothetical protein